MKPLNLINKLSLPVAILAHLVAVQAQQTPASFSLIATPDADGNDGSEQKPFRGSGIELFLKIEDETPGAYQWGGFLALRIGGGGEFCPGRFQFFGTENRLFFLKLPRVASGTVVIRVSGLVQETGFELQTVEGDFFIAQHPFGCDGSVPPTGGNPVINSFSANNSTNTAKAGGTIRLSARATDDDTSLTFFFFRTTASAPIGTLPGIGCTTGCTVTLDVPAPLSPTIQLFSVEVKDSDDNIDSRSISVFVMGLDGDGGGQVREIPALGSLGLLLLLASLGISGAYVARQSSL